MDGTGASKNDQEDPACQASASEKQSDVDSTVGQQAESQHEGLEDMVWVCSPEAEGGVDDSSQPDRAGTQADGDILRKGPKSDGRKEFWRPGGRRMEEVHEAAEAGSSGAGNDNVARQRRRHSIEHPPELLEESAMHKGKRT